MSFFLLFNILGAQATQGHQVPLWGAEQPSSPIGDNTATPGSHAELCRHWSGQGTGNHSGDITVAVSSRLSPSLDQRDQLGGFVFRDEPTDVKVWFAGRDICYSEARDSSLPTSSFGDVGEHVCRLWADRVPLSRGDHTATPDPHDVWSGTTWRDHGEGTCNGETPTTEHFSLNALTFMQLNHEMNNYHHVSSFSTDWMRRDDNSGCPREAKLRRSFCILPSHYHTADLPESRLRDAVVGRFWASPGTNPSLSCGGGAAAVAQEDIFSKHRHMQSRLADSCALGSFGRDFSTKSESDVLPDNEHEGEVEPIMQLFSLMQSSVEIVRVIEGGKLADWKSTLQIYVVSSLYCTEFGGRVERFRH